MGLGAIVRALVIGLLLGLSASGARAAIQCPTQLKLDGAAVTGAGGTPQASVDPSTGDLICRYQGIHPLVLFANYPPPFCSSLTIKVTASGGSAGWKFGPPGSPQKFAESATARFISFKSEADPFITSYLGCVYGDKDYDIAVWQPNPPGEACTADNPGATFNCAAMCPASVKGPTLEAEENSLASISFMGSVQEGSAAAAAHASFNSLAQLIEIATEVYQSPAKWNLSGPGAWKQPEQSVQCSYSLDNSAAPRWTGSFTRVCAGTSCAF